jgi:hypothetical protein
MLHPLLPTFVTGTLDAPVVALGVAEGLADAVAVGMKLVAGRRADRSGSLGATRSRLSARSSWPPRSCGRW